MNKIFNKFGSRGLSQLEEFQANNKENISVKELISLLKEEQESIDKFNLEKDQETIDKFSGQYLKYIDEDSIFGREINLYEVGEIRYITLDTSWQRVYKLDIGQHISISRHWNKDHSKAYGVDTKTISSSMLDCYEVISEEEFKHYITIIEEISKLISSAPDNI